MAAPGAHSKGNGPDLTAVGKTIRRWLIAGLIVIAPLGVTAYVLWWLFTTLDGLIGRYLYPVIGMTIPGLGLLILVGMLLLVGWLAERTIGAQMLTWWNAVLDRVPVVSRLYGATRRIVGSVFGGGEQRFFREVVLFEYPLPGQWTLGFVTGRAPIGLADRMDDGVTIFLPTAPNPITGFLIIVPRERTIPLPVTIEEGFTFILSAGAVPPGGPLPGGTLPDPVPDTVADEIRQAMPRRPHGPPGPGAPPRVSEDA